MDLKEFANNLEKVSGYPVAFYQFPKEEEKEPPFICYITPDAIPFSADGVVYYSGTKVQVELYTLNKDEEAQKKVEEALASFYFVKNEDYIESEKMYMTTYQLSL